MNRIYHELSPHEHATLKNRKVSNIYKTQNTPESNAIDRAYTSNKKCSVLFQAHCKGILNGKSCNNFRMRIVM